MTKDIPYSELKKDKKAYEIMILRDQYENTYTDIGNEYEISTERVKQLYSRIKLKQINLYIKHIAAVTEKSEREIRKDYYDLLNFYQSRTCVCAYLEEKYKDILTKYRCGEPGMPEKFLKALPPYREDLSPGITDKIIKMKEEEKKTFIEIGKELDLTREKARDLYEHFYHKKAMELFEALESKAKSSKEKNAIWDYYFKNGRSRKKIYDMLKGK